MGWTTIIAVVPGGVVNDVNRSRAVGAGRLPNFD